MITKLDNSDWPANILAGSHFKVELRMSPDSVCAIGASLAGYETGSQSGVVKNSNRRFDCLIL